MPGQHLEADTRFGTAHDRQVPGRAFPHPVPELAERCCRAVVSGFFQLTLRQSLTAVRLVEFMTDIDECGILFDILSVEDVPKTAKHR